MSPEVDTINSETPIAVAPFACAACRSQKKRCDKIFPACSACVRLRRACKYSSGPAPPPKSGDYQELVERVKLLENEISQQRALSDSRSITSPRTIQLGLGTPSSSNASEFPSIFFLDLEIFQKRRLKAPRPSLAVPEDVWRAIGDDVEVRTTVKSYFFSAATWMAMVSKLGLQQDIGRPGSLEPDVSLLILSMKLVNERLPGGQQTPRSPLYALTKRFFSNVESGGIGSIHLLQAGILITLYEIGHCIYPEAYLSIGHCGRLGQAIGLHDTAGIPQLSLEPESWDEMEERRRVWWAIFILDRYMQLYFTLYESNNWVQIHECGQSNPTFGARRC